MQSRQNVKDVEAKRNMQPSTFMAQFKNPMDKDMLSV